MTSVTPLLPFSVLLPVYGGDQPDYVRRAFASVVLEQTLRPDEVVIVRDGPVPGDLTSVLEELVASSPVPVKFVALVTQHGLGPALDIGLQACSHDVVARMDADDIALPNRFERQVPLMQHADIVGAGLIEFSAESGKVLGTRVPPVGPERIRAYARAHDPFNHPTVIYRRSAIVAAGGYGNLPLMEDYWLFARMLANGARADNIPEPLVYYRVGEKAYKRRGGIALLRSELQLQRQFRNAGFTTPFEYARNTTIRAAYRLLPWQLRRGLYRGAKAAYGVFAGQSSASPNLVGPPHVGLMPPPRADVDDPRRVETSR